MTERPWHSLELRGRVAWLEGRELRDGDWLEVRLGDGSVDCGHFWRPADHPWIRLVSSSRWLAYILSEDSLLRRPRSWRVPEQEGVEPLARAPHRPASERAQPGFFARVLAYLARSQG